MCGCIQGDSALFPLYVQFLRHQPCLKIRFDDPEGSTVHVQDELVEALGVEFVSKYLLGFLAMVRDFQIAGIVFQVIARIINDCQVYLARGFGSVNP